MANAPITRPKLIQSPGQAFPGLTLTGVTDGSNSFAAQQFVVLTSGALVKYAADGVALYGLTPDASHAATDEPYTQPYGEVHNVIALKGARFLMNVTDGSGSVGSGSTTQGDVAVGTLYSGFYLASVDTNAVGVDASDTGTSTKHIFRVEALWPEDATTDKNGRVIVSILDNAIQ